MCVGVISNWEILLSFSTSAVVERRLLEKSMVGVIGFYFQYLVGDIPLGNSNPVK